MGCIQSLICKPRRLRRENIVVEEFSATIDSTPTVVEESSPIVLRYKTPYFRASARLVVPPIPPGQTWVVGFVQACDHMEFHNVYGELGISSWELPALRDGHVSAISDSDGVSYPWYGNTTETASMSASPRGGGNGSGNNNNSSGSRKPIRVHISMNDNFYPSVTWAVPVHGGGSGGGGGGDAGTAPPTPWLSRVTRDQTFTTWLVALNPDTRERLVLRTVRWRVRLRIDVEPWRPLGQRARLVGPARQEQPLILPRNEPIPTNALERPSANDAQVLMWRPKCGPCVVVIPPKQ
ncbi:protein FAM78B-like isoform X2 [Petromyzon marinus]|uniref:protein FAM78B-like isoform X2 n=1 Tax=Petromyzon marinus TaxID=7757 RepID=UPI003F726F3D